MKIHLQIASWLLIAILGASFHFGPGQEILHKENLSLLMIKAQNAIKNNELELAVENLMAARKILSGLENPDKLKELVEIEAAKLQLARGMTAEASDTLVNLIDQTRKEKPQELELITDMRQELARAHYYRGISLRKSGHVRPLWIAEFEKARQHLRLTCENKPSAEDLQALEASIYLQRIDLDELSIMPLPSPSDDDSGEGEPEDQPVTPDSLPSQPTINDFKPDFDSGS